MNAAELDTKEELKLLADELTKRVGYPVVVDKIANLFSVHRVYRTTKLKAQVTEQELLASDRPVMDVLLGLMPKLKGAPPHVKVPKKGISVRGIEGHSLVFVGYPCWSCRKSELFEDYSHEKSWEWALHEDGWADIFTFSSDKGLAVDETDTELRQGLHRLLSGLGDASTLFILNDFKSYEDPDFGVAQSWADIFILKGKWTYADGRFQQL